MNIELHRADFSDKNWNLILDAMTNANKYLIKDDIIEASDIDVSKVFHHIFYRHRQK